MKKTIAIIGAGGFGIAFAKLLSSYEKYSIILWSAVEKEIEEILTHKENKKLLPGVFLNLEKVYITTNKEKLNQADIVIFAVASKYMRVVVQTIKDYLKKDVILLNASKGLETNSFKRMSEIIFDETKSEKIAVISGPSHAEEVAKLKPTTVVIASKNLKLAEYLQNILFSNSFRVYVNEDIIGVEIAAALKNIFALAIGICDGMKLGDNLKAALMTRGLVEMERFGVFLGANSKTFTGLAGLGDLIVTCTSLLSRNKRAGILIGEGIKAKKAIEKINMTVEGYFATKIVYEFSKKNNLNMPIVEQLYKVLFQDEDVEKVILNLMTRTKKHEYENF